MGNIVSATAADERERLRRQKRRDKREKRRRHLLKQKHAQFDESGNQLHYDAHGNQYFYDSKGNPFYVNESGTQFYIDDYGAPYYLEENGKHYYLDENGEKFYLDENREPYYVDKYGQKYFLDTEGKKYYLDDDGNAYLAHENDSPNVQEKNAHDSLSTQFKERRMGLNSRQTSESVTRSIHLDSQERQIRSPATPLNPSTANTDQHVGMFEHRNNSSGTLKSSIQASDTLGLTNKYKSDRTLKSMEIWDETGVEDGDTTTGTLSTYSTLSFMKSEYEQDIAVTPDYIKDESMESETRNAQIEAENRILQKLLGREKERANLPPGKLYRKVGKFEIKVKGDQKDCMVSGQAVLPDGNLIIADSNNVKLKLFDQELEFMTSYNTEFTPQGICSGTKDQLVHILFKTRMNNAIQIVDCEYSKIVPKQTINLYESPYTIARSNQDLAVVVYDSNKGWQLNLMDIKGKLSQNIDIDDVLVKPECLAITADLKIFISDSGSNSVYCFDSKGEELFQYKQLREPKGLCTDGKGSVFITSPGVVHQVSESGERIKALMRREIIGFAPLGVCYDFEDGLMVVTGSSNTITAFELS